MNPVVLSASMMCVSPWKQTDQVLEDLQNCGIDRLHIDVMDGHFVPNLMMGTESLRHLRQACPIPMDIHLMIEHPEEKLGWFDIRPGDYVSVHAESTPHLQRALQRIRDLGALPIAALNPATPLCMIEDVLVDVAAVMLMSVNPGYAGQIMIPQILGKITRLRCLLNENGLQDTRVEVDGNASFENIGPMRKAGADMFVCGTSSLFAAGGSVTENAQRLRSILRLAKA